jgi:hypothetical protein
MFAFSNSAVSQTTFKEVKAGHVFNISLPDYMSKTIGLNNSATIQFKSVVKDVYGFIIEDFKEDLKLVEMNYGNVSEFYDDFVKDFLTGEKNRKVMKPVTKTIGQMNFVESGISYYDKEAKADIYYYIGIAESSTTFYKVLCWTSLEAKDKFLGDLQTMLFSIKD